MSESNQTLRAALETSDMLEIDGLHAFEFSMDEKGLFIQAMDGRAEKRWEFTAAQVEAAVFNDQLQSWLLNGDAGEHRLVCLSAFTGNNNNDDESEVADEV